MPFGTLTLNDGTQIPSIAYGTGSVWKRQDVAPYVKQALETGFIHLDTAAFYQTEGGVADGIDDSGLNRHDLYITTKFGGRSEDITRELQVSLENLRLKYVDLYLIHFPFVVPDGDFEGAWRKMEQIQREGFAKSIGVSNFMVEDLQKIMKTAKIIPAVNQILLHPYNYLEMMPTIEYCQSHNIVLEAYSSLTPITKEPGGPVDSVLSAIAKRRDATPAQIIQAWVASKDIIIVTTSSKKSRLQEYLAVADLPPLTDAEIFEIEAAGAKGAPSTLVDWGVLKEKTGNALNMPVVVGLLVIFSMVLFVFIRRRKGM